jgi:hypothetical protein
VEGVQEVDRDWNSALSLDKDVVFEPDSPGIFYFLRFHGNRKAA